MSLFGPLFRYELTRLARRGTQPKLRAAFAGLLLVALFLAYLAAFPGTGPLILLTQLDQPMTVEAASRFGERFLVSFLLIQAAVVMLVTPAIAAGAIGEDKERGALELLLTTALTPWEIVVGKLAARLLFVASLLLTGLPLVAFVILFGGVDIGQLVAGYAIALLTILSLGTFAAFLSVRRETLGNAILVAYLVAFGLFVLELVSFSVFNQPIYLSPIAATWRLFDVLPSALPEIVRDYACLHLAAALVLLVLTVRNLCWFDRSQSAPPARPRVSDYLPWEEDGSPRVTREPPPAWMPQPVPRVDGRDVFSWKERYFGSFYTGLHGRAAVLVPVLYVMILGCLGWCVGPFLVTAGSMLALILVGIETSASVARERQHGTLDALLALPRDRWEILWAKLCMAFVSSRGIAIASLLLAAPGIGLGVLGLHVDSFPAVVTLPVVVFCWLMAAAGFGLWLSVRCETVQRAVGYWFGGFVFVCIGPLLAAPIVRESVSNLPDSTAPIMVAVCEGFSPPMAIYNSVPWQWHPPRSPRRNDMATVAIPYVGAVLAAFPVALIGVLFVLLAERRFEQNTN